jgi:SAM-dependent methyltransferase
MVDPYQAFENWIRICKPGGHIITTIPDEDMYEQGVWPSTNNQDHKTSWTLAKTSSWSPVSVNLFDFLNQFRGKIEVIKVEKMNQAFMFDVERFDQTYHHIAECAIEFIVRKLTPNDIARKGRLPK